MTTAEFEQHVARRAKEDLDLNYAVIAICGEAGEVAEWYKKAVLRKNKIGLTDKDLALELGDVLYYITRAAQLKGWTLADLFQWNREKLEERVRAS